MKKIQYMKVNSRQVVNMEMGKYENFQIKEISMSTLVVSDVIKRKDSVSFDGEIQGILMKEILNKTHEKDGENLFGRINLDIMENGKEEFSMEKVE